MAGTAKIPSSTADYAPFVAGIQSSGAEASIIAFPQQMIVHTIRAADQSGLQIRRLLNTGGITEGDLASLPAAQTSRMTIGTATLSLRSAAADPETKVMADDIAAEFQAGNAAADPAKPFPNALVPWPAVTVLPTLLKDKQTIDAGTLTEALNAARDIPMLVQKPWTPTAAGPANFPQVSNHNVYLNTVKDGKLVLASPEPVDRAGPRAVPGALGQARHPRGAAVRG